jgi:hypothetical protein
MRFNGLLNIVAADSTAKYSHRLTDKVNDVYCTIYITNQTVLKKLIPTLFH